MLELKSIDNQINKKEMLLNEFRRIQQLLNQKEEEGVDIAKSIKLNTSLVNKYEDVLKESKCRQKQYSSRQKLTKEEKVVVKI